MICTYQSHDYSREPSSGVPSNRFSSQITVRFDYQWLDETFREMATYAFFVLTGYKFRPASATTYFTVPSDEVEPEDEDKTDVVYVSKLICHV